MTKVTCGNIEGLEGYRFVTIAFNPITGRNIILTKHRDLKFARRSQRNMGRECEVCSISELELVAV